MHEPDVRGRMIRFGPFELDTRSSELRKGPTRLRVPDQSIQILKALVEHPGELVTRDQLRERLWPSDTFVDFEHGLNAAIRRLREAIGDSADAPRFIETLPRRGYRFIAPVEGNRTSAEKVESDSSPLAPANTAPSASPTAGSDSRVLRHVTDIKPRVLLLAGLVVLVLGMVWWSVRGSRNAPASTSNLNAKSIPVTSLAGAEVDPDLSPDGSQVAFAWDRDSGENFDIFVKLIETGEPQQLTSDPAADRSPAWSPNGTWIAFLRATSIGATAYVVPATGGQERRVADLKIAPESGQFRSVGLSWTPDSHALLVVDREPSGLTAIFLCPINTDERQQLTYPPKGFGDNAPAISPDGQNLAFVRRTSGFNLGSVFVQRLEGLRPVGEPRPITRDRRTGTLAWTHDSRSVVFELGDEGLWRTAIAGGLPQPIVMNVRATEPSIDRAGKRLVYQVNSTDANIWRVAGPEAWTRENPQSAAERIAGSTLFELSPQFSPDGNQLAFVSSRSGEPEIWISGNDGSKPTKLTSFSGGTLLGSPRWSPEQKLIAFDSMRSGNWNVYVVGVEDGRVRPVTSGTATNTRPSWSGDGKWIYFGSNRDGDYQIWKIPFGGGEAQKVTMNGGYEAFESPDRKYIYYAKPPGIEGIWRVQVDGGSEVQVIDHGRQISWALADRGIALLDRRAKPLPKVEFFRFPIQQAEVGFLPAGVRLAPPRAPQFSMSRDGRWMAYVNYDQWGSDIHMLPGSW